MKELWKYFEKNDHDISIDECGIQTFSPGQSYNYNTYQNFIIHYIESGRGIYEVDNQRYELSAGEGFIIRKGTKVRYYADASDPWKYYWVGLNGRHLDGYMKLTTLHTNYLIKFPEKNQSSQIIKEICHFTRDYSETANNMVWYKYKLYELHVP